MTTNVDADVSGKVSGAVVTPGEARTQHPNRPWLAAPWQPGQSGNPAGKPKNPYSLAALVRAEAEKRPELAVKIVDMACAGNVQMCELVLAYTDGKPVQRVERTDEERLAAFQELQATYANAVMVALAARAAAEAGAVPRLTEASEQP